MYTKYFKYIVLFTLLLQFPVEAFSVSPFKFAVFSDLHIAIDNSQPTADLQSAINEINAALDVEFVLVSGDITQLGDSLSLVKAKQMLSKLHVPYYITAGNHDFCWNSAGLRTFNNVFGANKFYIEHNGYRFISITSAPSEKYKSGHFQPQDLDWLKANLKKIPKHQPVFFMTHYPLLPGDVDNGPALEKVLRICNLQAVMSGHYHRNVCLNYNGTPSLVLRSTLRAQDEVGGYTIISISDSMRVYEKKINKAEECWISLPLKLK